MRQHRYRILLAVLAAAPLALFFWPEDPPAASGAWMARAGITPRFATLENTRVRYVRQGQGPALLLLHGFASSIYSWAHVIPELSKTHDVVAVDLPPFGASEVRSDVSGAQYVTLVPLLMDRLELPKATLVGNSLGGGVAALVAARHPDRVERLVLIDAAGFNLASSERPWLLRLLSLWPAPGLIEHLSGRRALVTLGLNQVFHDDRKVDREKIEEYFAPLARPGMIRALQELLSSAHGMGLPEALGQVQAPTLVIWGREDRWIPVEHADRFAAAIPGARKAVIEGCGHVPQEERPDEVLRLMREFLASDTGRKDLAQPVGAK